MLYEIKNRSWHSGSLVVKLLDSSLEGCQFKSLYYQTAISGPLSKALNYSIV